MSATDLVVALSRCESEPIHQIGHIQSYGVLVSVACDEAQTILRCSANLSEFFPLLVEEVLGKPLAQLLGVEQARDIGRDEDWLFQATSAQVKWRSGRVVYSVIGDTIIELQTLLHRSGGEIVIEFEPISAPLPSSKLLTLFEHVRESAVRFTCEASPEECCQYFTHLVREVTGFERVMLYRFDTSWDGEVVAESKSPEVAAYLGHRFPAGDIPPQARALYARNPLRFVMDAQAAPVALLDSPEVSSPLDMSHSILRAFSPVHVEYLRNMGVRASLSVSVVVRGQLWGLIACHSAGAYVVSQPVRNVIEFIGNLIAMRVTAFENIRQSSLFRLLDEVSLLVTRSIYSSMEALDLSAMLALHQVQILNLVAAETVLIQFCGQRIVLGQALGIEVMDRISEQILDPSVPTPLVTECLSKTLSISPGVLGNVAGVLACRVGGGSDFMAWLRPEKVRQIHWAGPPDKAVLLDAEGLPRICPRQSFETWTEVWRQRSVPWEPGQVQVADMFARTLIETLHHRAPEFAAWGDQGSDYPV